MGEFTGGKAFSAIYAHYKLGKTKARSAEKRTRVGNHK